MTRSAAELNNLCSQACVANFTGLHTWQYINVAVCVKSNKRVVTATCLPGSKSTCHSANCQYNQNFVEHACSHTCDSRLALHMLQGCARRICCQQAYKHHHLGDALLCRRRRILGHSECICQSDPRPALEQQLCIGTPIPMQVFPTQ